MLQLASKNYMAVNEGSLGHGYPRDTKYKNKETKLRILGIYYDTFDCESVGPFRYSLYEHVYQA